MARIPAFLISISVYICHMLVDQQTQEDLEFDSIRKLLASFCIGPTATDYLTHLHLLDHLDAAQKALTLVQEYIDIQSEETVFPRLDFTELQREIVFLHKQGSQLTLESFIHLLRASKLANALVKFIKRWEEEYPGLYELIHTTEYSDAIIQPIEKVIDNKNQIRDNASPRLLEIRTDIRRIRSKINANFDRVLKKLQGSGVLADTSESFVKGKRVLAVSASHKRTIPGGIIGSSNNGHVAYVEPKVNQPLHAELEILLDEEHVEIARILKALTKEIQSHVALVESYQYLFPELDIVQAKARLARRMDAVKPLIEEKEQLIDLIDAHHPLLLMANNALEKTTIPQSLKMDKFSRIMVISGPNAGGKSITLKTIGLLQLMFQSGLLVPVDPRSKMSWFRTILSDIGDNQSIENELSTYSYRLQRMKYFMEVANKKTLLLLDEFGTGSDPELGGALAEVFFENLYNKKCFGVFTTHYANIKLKASRLQNAVNASMLFDRESLAPMFELSVGQPGSSFTFEVAQINGIDVKYIDHAKSLLDTKRVELDKLIADLQKEKSVVQKINTNSQKAEEKALETKSYYEDLQEHLHRQIQKQQEIQELNNKWITLGKKLNQFLDQTKNNKVSKPLMEEIKKYLIIEKSKQLASIKKAKLKKEVNHPSPKKKKIVIKKSAPKVIKPIVVGAMVKIIGSSEKGEVVSLSGKNAVVVFGNFQTKTKIDKLEAV